MIKSHSLFPGIGEGDILQMEMYVLLSGRKEEGRVSFLHLLFPNCLQLKIILMPKGHILGWCIPIPFISIVLDFFLAPLCID